MSFVLAAQAARRSILDTLIDTAEALPAWQSRDTAMVALTAVDSATRKVVLPGKWGVGRALWEPFPTPCERLADAPLWVETTSHIVGFRSTPPEGVRTGILFAPIKRPTWPELVSARFVVAPPGLSPFALPGCCLVDVGAHDLGNLAYGDFLREREGLKLARDATRSELLQMYETVRMLDDGTMIACRRAEGGVNVRAAVDPYHPIRDHGAEGLRGAFAATAVQLDPQALTQSNSAEAGILRLLGNSLILRGPHAALSALRLAALN